MPDLASLFALHRRHVEKVVHENLIVQLGRTDSIEPSACVTRVLSGWGGGCFHLNGVFSALLRHLGYDVHRHRGEVRLSADQPEPAVAALGNHMALTVSVEGTAWMVDVGLGNGLYEPLPLAAGSRRQGPFTYTLSPREDASGTVVWQFVHDPALRSWYGMDFSLRDAEWQAFTERHAELATSPDSVFVQLLQLNRRDAAGLDTLMACTLVRTEAGGCHERRLETRREWLQAVADVFGLHLPGVGDAELSRLWRKVCVQQTLLDLQAAKAGDGRQGTVS
ncbi:arylamine N-acetyltransferase [Streptomyces sp. NPDC059003]|uniref:arylamine N-acetyltransferase family protein n=1 Tax=Streptomyces sp. NPDC059003 TaxID=3346691 RepID=UPI0036BC8DED